MTSIERLVEHGRNRNHLRTSNKGLIQARLTILVLAIVSADSFGSPARRALTPAKEVARMSEGSFRIALSCFRKGATCVAEELHRGGHKIIFSAAVLLLATTGGVFLVPSPVVARTTAGLATTGASSGTVMDNISTTSGVTDLFLFTCERDLRREWDYWGRYGAAPCSHRRRRPEQSPSLRLGALHVQRVDLGRLRLRRRAFKSRHGIVAPFENVLAERCCGNVVLLEAVLGITAKCLAGCSAQALLGRGFLFRSSPW